MIWCDEKIIGFDFETSGILPEYALQPWRIPRKKMWASSLVHIRKTPTDLIVKGTTLPRKRVLQDFLEEVLDTKSRALAWNAAFDIAIFLAYGFEKLVMQIDWLDGMLLWRHWFLEPEYDATSAYKRKSYGLKACVAEYLPQYEGYGDDVDFHDMSPENLTKLHTYNRDDVVFTMYLARKWYLQLQQNPQRLKAALLEARCLPLIARANLDGMVVDTLAARELRAHLIDVAAKQLATLAPDGITETVVRSPAKLSKLLFEPVDEGGWGLTVVKRNVSKITKKVTNSTDKEVLHELSYQDSRANDLRTYREALNNRTKFAEAPLKSVDYNEDGRSHPNAIIFGTYSGRMTYASKQGRNKDARPIGFALHQEKRDAMYRDIIVAPEGHTLMEFDAAGQEFRWMAIASGDPTMLQLCVPGEDPHSYMGSQVTATDYRQLVADVHASSTKAKATRQLGKVANLSLQYRTSAAKLRSVARVQYDIPMEITQATLIHGTYRKVYRRVPMYWAAQIRQTRQTGYVETFAGRRVEVTGNWEGSWGWSMGSTAINYRIQGTGADQKYLALAVLRPYLTKYNIKFGWDLHDGIYLYVPDEHVERAATDIRHLLNNLPYQQAWGFSPPIDLPWDTKSGKAWGALKEWQYD